MNISLREAFKKSIFSEHGKKRGACGLIQTKLKKIKFGTFVHGRGGKSKVLKSFQATKFLSMTL